MSEAAAPRAKGIVLAHGEMALGLVDAARKISGQGDDVLTALSNEGRSPSALREALEALIGDGPAVIFTDLQAGSCALAAVASSQRAETIVVCGANLPMLLDFIFHRDMPIEALSERLVEKGREGIRSLRLKVGSSAGPERAQGRGSR